MNNIKKHPTTLHLCPSNPEKKKHINPYEQGIFKQRQLTIHYDKLYDRYQLDKIDNEKDKKELNQLLFQKKDVEYQMR